METLFWRQRKSKTIFMMRLMGRVYSSLPILIPKMKRYYGVWNVFWNTASVSLSCRHLRTDSSMWNPNLLGQFQTPFLNTLIEFLFPVLEPGYGWLPSLLHMIVTVSPMRCWASRGNYKFFCTPALHWAPWGRLYHGKGIGF